MLNQKVVVIVQICCIGGGALLTLGMSFLMGSLQTNLISQILKGEARNIFAIA